VTCASLGYVDYATSATADAKRATVPSLARQIRVLLSSQDRLRR
jgi:hypothetical protein